MDISAHGGNSLELSEDKSIDLIEEEHHEHQEPLEPIDEEYIDPLDQFMQDIEGEAAPQMDINIKSRNKVISYDEIVMSTYFFTVDDYTNTTQKVEEDEEEAEKSRKNFFEALNKMEETKKEIKTDGRGVLM